MRERGLGAIELRMVDDGGVGEVDQIRPWIFFI